MVRFSSLQEIANLKVPSVPGPTRWRVPDLFVLDIDVGSVLDQELNHVRMAVQSGVMQARPRVVKSSRNNVDLRALVQQQLRGVDVTMHAAINECVIQKA